MSARVDFAPSPLTPAIDEGFAGIAVAVESRSSHGTLTTLRIHGVYRVSVDVARDVGAIPLQKALVVVATSGLFHASFRLAGETLAFVDDEHAGGGMVTGYFNAELLDRFDVAPYGTGYVMVSLGTIVSNVASFTATV